MRERQMRRGLGIALLVTALFAAASSTHAATIQLPLNLNYLTLDAAIKASVFTQPGGRARLWEGGNECQYLDATNPRFSREGSGTKLEADGRLVLGFPVGDRCVGPIDWTGIIASSLDPYMSGLALKWRVTDINLFDQQHQKSALIGHSFDLIKQNFIPAIQTFSYDLAPSVKQLGQLAELGAANATDATRIRQSLATLRPFGSIIARDAGLRITLQMELLEPPTAGANFPSAEPIAPGAAQPQWQTALENWDSFLVFAVKQLATAVPDPAVRQQLLNVLLDSRERLVTALTQPASGPDPVRLLFLDEWTQLRDIIEVAAARGAIGDHTLEFLSFISAGDALFALDQAAPMLGIRITADDLRRLARIMTPQVNADPLVYNFDEDPELRSLLGIAPPLESDDPLDSSDDEQTQPAPSDTPFPSPAPGPLSRADRSRLRELLSRLASLLDSAADAADAKPQSTLQQLGHLLHRAVVNDTNAAHYRTAMNQLLTLVAGGGSDSVQAGRESILPLMVKTTAWQESCWRQFEIRKQRVRYLESASGDIGLMQVNKYVWRGFYSLPRLKWDIVYNASAGAGILNHLLLNAPDHLRSPSTDQPSVARSLYSAYNGGPSAYYRWLRHGGNADARAADEGFAAKVVSMQQGQAFDILSCAAAWDRSHSN